MHIEVSEELFGKLAAEMRSGRYASMEELLNDAIRHVQRRPPRVIASREELDAALQEAENQIGSGDFIELKDEQEMDAFFEALVHRVEQRAPGSE